MRYILTISPGHTVNAVSEALKLAGCRVIEPIAEIGCIIVETDNPSAALATHGVATLEEDFSVPTPIKGAA